MNANVQIFEDHAKEYDEWFLKNLEISLIRLQLCQMPLTVLKCFGCSISPDRSQNPVAGTFWLHSLKTPFSDEILQFRFQAQFLILLAGYGAEVSAQTGEGLQIQTPGEDSFLFSPLSPFRPLCGSVRSSL